MNWKGCWMSHYARNPNTYGRQLGRHIHEKKCENPTCDNTIFGYSSGANVRGRGTNFCSPECREAVYAPRRYYNVDRREMRQAKRMKAGKRPDNQRFILNRISRTT